MSTQQVPLTYEGLPEWFRQSSKDFDRRMEESRREWQEQSQKTERMIQELVAANKEAAEERGKMRTDIGKWDDKIGRIIEYMIGEDDIVSQFQALGYDITTCYRDRKFGKRGTDESGQIDLILEDGDVVILIEVKTTLRNDDILEHIERIKKYRHFADVRGKGDQKFVGAVAGAVVAENVEKFAQSKGMYVITQTGETFQIIQPPEGFKVKEW